MAPSTLPAYAKDERVLCFHHELLYEAKVLDFKPSDSSEKKSPPQYLVHYKGWKNTWDDWVPQDRLRKLNDENKELAKNLKKEMDHLRQRAAPKAVTASSKKKAAGSDLSSARGSEERHSSVPATGRGQKRGRDFEIEKVGEVYSPLGPFFVSSDNTSQAQPSPKTSPGLPRYAKFVGRGNSRSDRSPLDLGWLSPPSKRLCLSLVEAGGSHPFSSPQHISRKPSPPLSPSSLSKSLDDSLLSQDSPPLSPNPRINRPLGAPPTRRGSRTSPEGVKPFVRIPKELCWRVAPFNPKKETGGLVNLLDLVEEYPARIRCRRAMIGKHPRVSNKPYNRALEQFYNQQSPTSVLMIAGYPLEDGPGCLKDSHAPIAHCDRVSGSKKKRSRQKEPNIDNSPMQEEAFHSRPSVRIVVPDHLKSILVDDWENVTKNLSLVPLPSPHPVNEILTTYFDEEKGKRHLGSADADLLEEVVVGVKEYFEKCLGRILLYRFEREQYFEMRQRLESGAKEWEGKGAGDVYGAEHLCRLFVSMPELIAQTNMDQQSVNRLREELAKLTQWLAKNSSRFFTSEYEQANQDYVEKARGV